MEATLSIEPLTFCPDAAASQGRCGVIPMPDFEPADALWEELSRNTARETNLIAYPPSVLRERWARGCAAIAVHNGAIISYTSIVPIYHEHVRERLAARLRLPRLLEHRANMYEFATGWTNPDWRRRGINIQLRRFVLDRFDARGNLFISLTVSLAASPVLARLGWQITAWNRVPFIASVIGVPIIGLEYCMGKMGWLHPARIQQYQGPHVCPGEEQCHDWDRYCHFWTSDLELAMAMNRHLSELLRGDLHRWREAIVSELTITPEALWKLNLFQERCL